MMCVCPLWEKMLSTCLGWEEVGGEQCLKIEDRMTQEDKDGQSEGLEQKTVCAGQRRLFAAYYCTKSIIFICYLGPVKVRNQQIPIILSCTLCSQHCRITNQAPVWFDTLQLSVLDYDQPNPHVTSSHPHPSHQSYQKERKCPTWYRWSSSPPLEGDPEVLSFMSSAKSCDQEPLKIHDTNQR